MTNNSPFPKRFINATALRIIACAFMLCDHLWGSMLVNGRWLTYIGRIALPIFAFQIAEGFVHTGNFKKYALRLLIFGLITEIPFDLMTEGVVFYPFHQNVLFTLLFGLLGCKCLEKIKLHKSTKSVVGGVFGALGCLLGGLVLLSDYGTIGILVVMAFYLIRDFKFAWLLQLAALLAIFFGLSKGECVLLPLFGTTLEMPIECFGIGALLPIWLYNGKKGSSAKWSQYAFYSFYPGHMLLLWGIGKIISLFAF